MYLHNDKELFTEVIIEANIQTGIAQSIIENKIGAVIDEHCHCR